jgi:hypothetical protein
LFHEFDAAVLFQAIGQGEVGEIQAAGGFVLVQRELENSVFRLSSIF